SLERLHRQSGVALELDGSLGRLQGDVRLSLPARARRLLADLDALSQRRPADDRGDLPEDLRLHRAIPGCLVCLARRDRELGDQKQVRIQSAPLAQGSRGWGIRPEPMEPAEAALRSATIVAGAKRRWIIGSAV